MNPASLAEDSRPLYLLRLLLNSRVKSTSPILRGPWELEAWPIMPPQDTARGGEIPALSFSLRLSQRWSPRSDCSVEQIHLYLPSH